MKNRIRLGIPNGTEAKSGRYPWPEIGLRDDAIRQQLDTIGKLVNSNLMDLADELWPYNTKVIKETDDDENIIPFPGKWHSD